MPKNHSNIYQKPPAKHWLRTVSLLAFLLIRLLGLIQLSLALFFLSKRSRRNKHLAQSKKPYAFS